MRRSYPTVRSDGDREVRGDIATCGACLILVPLRAINVAGVATALWPHRSIFSRCRVDMRCHPIDCEDAFDADARYG